MCHVCIMVGGAPRAWPDTGQSVSPVPALSQSLTDR